MDLPELKRTLCARSEITFTPMFSKIGTTSESGSGSKCLYVVMCLGGFIRV